MLTRTAAKRAAALKTSFEAGQEENGLKAQDVFAHPNISDEATTVNKRKYTSAVNTDDSIVDGWDILPHGLGKKGDLVELGANNNVVSTGATSPGKKKAKLGSSSGTVETGTKVIKEHVKLDNQIKQETNASALPSPLDTTPSQAILFQVPELPSIKAPARSVGAKRNAKKGTQKTQASRGAGQQTKTESGDGDEYNFSIEDAKTPEEMHRENGAHEIAKSSVLPTPLKGRKKKHPYGLSPGYSPFPNHVGPSIEQCEEVHKLLSGLHGLIEQPKAIPPPSMKVTGCGEVPDLMEALLRTLLSAATTSKNSGRALAGLNKKFGPRKKEFGDGINWEAVHEADVLDVIDAIKSGGLAVSKGNNIKKILNIIFERNLNRHNALLAEKAASKPAQILGAAQETEPEKDHEIATSAERLLQMDYIFNLSTEDAMDELTKLPAIGVKTASCVILFCMQRPSFAVDTHVWRHCKWLGWVPEQATRDQTFSHCEVRIPDKLKYGLHQLFVRHGKTCGRCRANTSPGSEEWNNTHCPIEHLVRRSGKMKDKVGRQKQAVNTTRKVKAAGDGTKKGSMPRKDSTGSPDVEMETSSSN